MHYGTVPKYNHAYLLEEMPQSASGHHGNLIAGKSKFSGEPDAEVTNKIP